MLRKGFQECVQSGKNDPDDDSFWNDEVPNVGYKIQSGGWCPGLDFLELMARRHCAKRANSDQLLRNCVYCSLLYTVLLCETSFRQPPRLLVII